MEKPAFSRAYLSDVTVIMAIMCISVVERLWLAVMGQVLNSSAYYQVCVGACGHVLSY
jgi:hypothetical protein